jgi:hypothetical protein
VLAQPHAWQLLQQMMEPEQQAANGVSSSSSSAAAGADGSSQPGISNGLVEDSVLMLQMLRRAKLLVPGPLLLALQAYLTAAADRPLPVPRKEGAQLQAAQVQEVLSALSRQQQLELRSFLLQVGPSALATHSSAGPWVASVPGSTARSDVCWCQPRLRLHWCTLAADTAFFRRVRCLTPCAVCCCCRRVTGAGLQLGRAAAAPGLRAARRSAAAAAALRGAGGAWQPG